MSNIINLNDTEITNGEASEEAPLADVADMLQSAREDRTKSRILNQPNWLGTTGDEGYATNRLIRADGRFGRPNALIPVVDTTFTGSFPEERVLWDVKVDEEQKLFFRMVEDGNGDLHPTVLWAYLADDLPDTVPVYLNELDGEDHEEEMVKLERARRFDTLGHVPVYDDLGIVQLTPEGADALGVIDGAELLDGHEETVAVEHVMVYKNWTLLASARFGTAESAAEWQALAYQHLRVRSPRAQANAARRMFVPGERPADTPVGQGAKPTPAPAPVATEPAKPRRQSVVKRKLREWLAE